MLLVSAGGEVQPGLQGNRPWLRAGPAETCLGASLPFQRSPQDLPPPPLLTPPKTGVPLHPTEDTLPQRAPSPTDKDLSPSGGGGGVTLT